MIQGQTWIFASKPRIQSSAVIVGPFEGKSPLAAGFDIIHQDIWLGQDSFEKAERQFLEQACEKAVEKAGLQKEDIQVMLSGDLMNQIISSSFAARALAIPYLGLFGACSSSMEGLALAALIIEANGADRVLAATSSHNSAAEKQFRYPTEYGAQKPPTAQWTVTGAGAAVVAREGSGPQIVSATIGKVVDMGISDPFNMGGAMAPAAVDTLLAHFRDTGTEPADYDLIATGDLGRVGHVIAKDLLAEQGFHFGAEHFQDCGMLIYPQDARILAGASGCACCAAVTYGHFFGRMTRGELKRILVVATGALLSPMSYQQKESIPCIAHGIAFEM